MMPPNDDVKMGGPPTALVLPIAIIGSSACPAGSYSAMLHKTVAPREAPFGR
jgi:hypothetical protein